MQDKPPIKVIIGLGNPGAKYKYTRHNIGFRVLDYLAQHVGASWNNQEQLTWASLPLNGDTILLIKPMTGMNLSGNISTFLQKKGILPEEIVVIHDELELPFGTLKLKQGGSARGHNGLRSLIAVIGKDFYRLRFGIGRPSERTNVPVYVLTNFDEPTEEVEDTIAKASTLLQTIL